VRNKAHLVSQGFSPVEGLYFREIFAHVPRIEAIRILLAFATSKGFKLYQMGVKSAFLNGVIQEEVYVIQPPGFENPKYPNRVYKLSKTLYGLKQVPQAWYAGLKTFFLEHEYVMESVDKTLFTLSCACVKFLGNDGDGVLDVHDGRTKLFLRYPSQANKSRYLHTSSHVHEGHDKEVQYGRAKACVYTDEHNNNVGSG
jgi:hypothetical protein